MDRSDHGNDGTVPDDRLRLISTCCHPALAPAARVALTLRLLGGLEVPDIARAFLVAETTIAQRITRAKRKIADARIPYRVPSATELPRYQVLAAINAVHTDAPTFADTDWSQIVRLYDLLVTLEPSPLVELNRAVAIGELDGPEVALARIDPLKLDTYHAWHATRAELLRRLNRLTDAAPAYEAAIASTANPAEQAFLRRRRDGLQPADVDD